MILVINMKFSILIPAYNVEKYIDECLKSLMNQTYNNFEVIIVNDGSTDNTEQIIKKYLDDKRFRYFKKHNTGQADTRNYAVSKSNGDYILFLDSDDYYDKNLLNNLNEELLKEKVDVIRFQCTEVYYGTDLVKEVSGAVFDTMNGQLAFEKMIRDEFFDTPWSYAFNRKYYVRSKFSFAKGFYHEDFDLIPFVVLFAKTVKSIPFNGYNYVIRENSTMTDPTKRKKRAYDMLRHFDNYILRLKNNKQINPTIKGDVLSFAANAVIAVGKDLNSDDLDKFINEMNKHEVIDYLASGGAGQWLKRHIIKHHTKWYMSR